MWIGSVPWSTLVRETRWPVELFASLDLPRMKSAYPMAQIGDLVAERRESLLPGRWPDFCFTYVGLENVASQTGILEGGVRKLGREVQSASGVFYEGDILYGRLRPYLNKVFLAEGRVLRGICSGEFLVLAPNKSRARPLFLREVLASAYVAEAVKGMQIGSALPRLQLKDLLKLEVPVPPLNAQDPIVATLQVARQELVSVMNAARTGGHRIRSVFETALREGGKMELSKGDSLDDVEPFDGLPPDYSVTLRGRRNTSPGLFD